jgi:hypothetical protein
MVVDTTAHPIIRLYPVLMTQIPPSLLQPSHQQRPPLLRANPAQKPMSPLPHELARVVRVSRPAANLHAAQARVCGDLASEVEGFRAQVEQRSGCARRGDGVTGAGGGEHGAARGKDREGAGLRRERCAEYVLNGV